MNVSRLIKRARREWEDFKEIQKVIFLIFLCLDLIFAGSFFWDVRVIEAAYSWTPADVQTTAEGYYASLAYDSAGNPGIAYGRLVSAAYDLYYAYYSDGSWSTEAIDTGSTKFNSLIFDGNDIPHISYYDASGWDLEFARRGASGTTTLNPDNGTGESNCGDTDWNCSTIDSTNNVGGETSLAIDSAGTLGIAYLYGTGNDLRYAWYTGSGGSGCAIASWSCEDVYTTNTVGRSPSLAFNGTTAYIAAKYIVSSPAAQQLLVASRDGSGSGNCDDSGANNNSWNCEIVDSGVDGTVNLRDISLVFSNGVFGGIEAVAYVVGSSGDLYYATRVGGGGGFDCDDSDWACMAVDTANDNGAYIDMIFAGGTVPAISYYEDTNDDLKYAELIDGSWVTETVDSANVTGLWNSIARTGTTTSIAYFDDTDDDLVLATATISYNVAPTVSINSVAEKSDGGGSVDISVTVDDANDDNAVKLKVGYNSGVDCSSPSVATLDETDGNTTATYGDPKVENDNAYQVGNSSGWITTSSGANTVQFDWLSATDAAAADGTYCIRVIASDGALDGMPAITTFTLDNVDPSGLGSFAAGTMTMTTAPLSWAAVTETNWSGSPAQAHYEIWYGTNQSDVQGRTGTASEWDNADDANLATKATTSTTITSLSSGTTYYFKIWAVDSYGNESTVADINAATTSAEVAIVVTDGGVAFGTVALNGGTDNSSDVQLVRVDTGPANLDVKTTVWSDGEHEWTFGESGGADQINWQFSPDNSNWTSFLIANTNYDLANNVAQTATQNLYLKIRMPTSTASYSQYSATVTVVASAP